MLIEYLYMKKINEICAIKMNEERHKHEKLQKDSEDRMKNILIDIERKKFERLIMGN